MPSDSPRSKACSGSEGDGRAEAAEAAALKQSSLVPISLRLDKELLAQIDAYCKQTGQGRSSFLRSAAVAVMEGSVPQGNTAQGSAVDQGARDALEALLKRVQFLEEELKQVQELQQEAREVLLSKPDEFAARFGQ